MSTVNKYRKKPVVIEAMQLVDDLRNHTRVATWITTGGGEVEIPFAEPCLFIVTMEGRMRAEIGDYIIRGVQGEFYPCKPDIFEATYELVECVDTADRPAVSAALRPVHDPDGGDGNE